MRKIDKLINLQKANLLSEQRYLENKNGITENNELLNELSPEIRNRAANVAKNKARDIEDKVDSGELNWKDVKDKRNNYERQQQKFGKSIHPSLEKEANSVAANLTPNGRLAVLEKYYTREPYIRLLFVDDENNQFELRIEKDDFNVVKNKFGVSFHPTTPPELEHLISNLQKELVTNQQ